VVCLEVIDLFLENDGPKIFAEELDYVQIVGEAWPISREAKGAIVREMLLKRGISGQKGLAIEMQLSRPTASTQPGRTFVSSTC
jgi:hypothetical protein